ncbi:M16 family metallopeptidase [Legionella micdadei]|uniref:Zinc protease n=1 Tax=Legionella micdadei TaxID=451 RepID=A0A098GJ70_LEGMI|nr:pitrilysin family protein [Legionella micdadei]ARG96612.1 peptidase M16 [Legionella micdadei]ARG99360.1 peptidase M16 [Legionella micdadei]KTD29354.1 zinc protease (peptidase, M16 family) [Legionella micdadei]NSL18901.1 insulinase family protein [Legionella micdadei]CEG62020.1 Zinc protease (Peptidase, M16 family) [Legionella micdadei]
MKLQFKLNLLKQFIGASLAFALTQPLHANTFKTQQWQTTNGAQVVFYQANEVPMLDISVAFAAGSAYDGNQFGLSTLTTNLINQGNAGMDATQVAEHLADTGAQFVSENSRDMVVLNLKTLTKPNDMKKALEIFTTIIAKPDFPKDAFEREKSQQLLAIAQTQESPEEVANKILFEKLYLNHPYAHPVNGTKDTVLAMSTTDVRNFHKKYFVGSNAVVVIVGAIDSATAHRFAEQIMTGLPKGQPAPSIPKAPPLKVGENIAVDFPSSQTILRLGEIGIDHHDPDYFPLTVGNYILGGGALVSILAHEVREKRGLTYGVTSQFLPMPGNGPFIISLSTENKEAANALKVTQETLAAYLKNGPTEKELADAKQYLMGSFPLSLSSNASIANMLLRIAFYHLPSDYLDTYVERINTVTTTQIREALQRKIHPDKMLVIAVGRM